MIVSPASRIDRAISFGVFCRSAPSTSAIIRSRNVSPGLAVIRTTISSLSTRVPPVTAERSPPDSRITGADSPVIADSSTVAMPSTIVAVAGDHLAGGDDAQVAELRAATTASRRSCRRRVRTRGDGVGPRLAQRRRLRLAAALGHRLGEVGEQHREPQPQRRRARRTRSRCRSLLGEVADEQISVVSTEPTSTMNITGLRTSCAGSSFLNASSERRPDDRRIEDRLRAPAALLRTFGGRWLAGRGRECRGHGCGHAILT